MAAQGRVSLETELRQRQRRAQEARREREMERARERAQQARKTARRRDRIAVVIDGRNAMVQGTRTLDEDTQIGLFILAVCTGITGFLVTAIGGFGVWPLTIGGSLGAIGVAMMGGVAFAQIPWTLRIEGGAAELVDGPHPLELTFRATRTLVPRSEVRVTVYDPESAPSAKIRVDRVRQDLDGLSLKDARALQELEAFLGD